MNIENPFTYQSLSCFKQRPSEKIRYIINRNLKQLINISIKQANEFTNTNSTKLKSLQQLKYTLLIGQQTITPFTEQILKSLVKTWQLDIENIDSLIFQIVQVIGYHVKSSYYIPLMLDMLQQEEFKNSSKNTIILLNLASHMFKNSRGLEQNIDSLAKTLAYFQNIFYDNDEGLVAIFWITQTLVNRIGKFQQAIAVTTFFSIILNVLATKSIKQDVRKQAANSMQVLAKKAGYNSVADLHAYQIDPILTKIIKNKQYVNWTRTSKDRFKFDTIIRNCHSQVIRFLPQTLQVLQFLINPQSDLQTRMDTLVLTQFMLNLSELIPALQPLSQQIMKKLLIPSIQWKIGKPQIKIRKAGMINMTLLIQNEIINEEQLLDCYKQLFPHLKNCLNDDWAPELRLASCQFLQKYLNATKQNIGTDQLRQLYPLLLQRLDDSQDPIRKKITISINLFFACRYVKLSESTLEYVIGAIFVHFDDTSEQIQDSIYVSLRFAAKVDPGMVLKAAKTNQKKMKNKLKCSQLIQFCQELILERSS